MKNAIIALDFSDTDNTLINYAKKLVHDKLGIKKLYFMNIIKDLTKPQKEIHQFIAIHEPNKNLDDKIKSGIEYRLNSHDANNLDYEVEVHEGSPYKKLLHWAEVKNSALVVMGVKDRSLHSGITSKRIVHNLEKDILLVPEKSTGSFNKILVPIDFSENCKRALEKAVLIASNELNSKITLLNVIQGTPPASAIGSYYAEYANMFIENAEQAMKNFIRECKVDINQIDTAIIRGAEYSISSSIHHYSELEGFDIMVVGAQSHNRFRNFIIGSVTESLIALEPKLPVLIVR